MQTQPAVRVGFELATDHTTLCLCQPGQDFPNVCCIVKFIKRRFAAALLPLLFGNNVPGHTWVLPLLFGNNVPGHTIYHVLEDI